MGYIQRKLVQSACFVSAIGIILCILLWPSFGRASSPAQLCEAATQIAAGRHGVPLDVLRAVALVETGRSVSGTLKPWPWAIHAAGEGNWFSQREEALRHAQENIAQGRRNVDLGCFQINFHWHGHQFISLEQMIDPAQNADYAASLLAQHKARHGTWERAVGAYHSATPDHANRYIARFQQIYALLAENALPPTQQLAHENRFALLHKAGEPKLGSLFAQAEQPLTRLIPLEPARP